MSQYRVLKDLKPTGQHTSTVYCGLVMVMPRRQVFGCGAKPEGWFRQFSYKLDGYDLWSSVSLCPNCERKVKGE